MNLNSSKVEFTSAHAGLYRRYENRKETNGSSHQPKHNWRKCRSFCHRSPDTSWKFADIIMEDFSKVSYNKQVICHVSALLWSICHLLWSKQHLVCTQHWNNTQSVQKFNGRTYNATAQKSLNSWWSFWAIWRECIAQNICERGLHHSTAVRMKNKENAKKQKGRLTKTWSNGPENNYLHFKTVVIRKILHSSTGLTRINVGCQPVIYVNCRSTCLRK